MKNLFLLFWEFFKLGLFTFGGDTAAQGHSDYEISLDIR